MTSTLPGSPIHLPSSLHCRVPSVGRESCVAIASHNGAQTPSASPGHRHFSSLECNLDQGLFRCKHTICCHRLSDRFSPRKAVFTKFDLFYFWWSAVRENETNKWMNNNKKHKNMLTTHTHTHTRRLIHKHDLFIYKFALLLRPTQSGPEGPPGISLCVAVPHFSLQCCPHQTCVCACQAHLPA